MNAGLPEGAGSPPYALHVDPDRDGELKMELLWPDDDSPCTVSLVVRSEDADGSASGLLVNLNAEVHFGDGRREHAVRNVRLQDGRTALFAVAGGDPPLTLALKAEVSVETVLAEPPRIDQPVLLELEIQAVIDGRTVSLERNELRTFVGATVSYSFRLGHVGEADAVLVRLTPLRVTGDIATVRVELTGSLPGDGTTQLVSRSEKWFCSRRVAATIPLEFGDPPNGYRFLLTADF
jgi:hypothetical protein